MSKLKYIKRLIDTNIYIFQKRYDIIGLNILYTSTPYLADFVVDSQENNNNDSLLHHYSIFIMDHLESYLITFIISFLLKVIYKKCKL